MYAILIPFVKIEDGDCFLLEVRSDAVPQPGEVCFPGGKIEPGESPSDAALRETCEELGIPARFIEIIDELPTDKMEDGRIIHPITARIAPEALPGLTPSGDEVASTFLLPLSWLKSHNPASFTLAGNRNYTTLPALLQGYLSHYAPFENTHDTYYWEYEGHGIWGMTARMIYRVLETFSK